jgi:hypothetical protein
LSESTTADGAFVEPVVATDRKRSQIAHVGTRLTQAKTVAMDCDDLPQRAHGKEGVDGSSPSEGFDENPANWPLVLSVFGASCVRGYETGTHSGPGGHSRASATSGVALRHSSLAPMRLAPKAIFLQNGRSLLSGWAKTVTPSLGRGGQPGRAEGDRRLFCAEFARGGRAGRRFAQRDGRAA